MFDVLELLADDRNDYGKKREKESGILDFMLWLDNRNIVEAVDLWRI